VEGTRRKLGGVWEKTPQFPALAISSRTFAGFVKGYLRRGTHRSGRVLEDAGTSSRWFLTSGMWKSGSWRGRTLLQRLGMLASKFRPPPTFHLPLTMCIIRFRPISSPIALLILCDSGAIPCSPKFQVEPHATVRIRPSVSLWRLSVLKCWKLLTDCNWAVVVNRAMIRR